LGYAADLDAMSLVSRALTPAVVALLWQSSALAQPASVLDVALEAPSECPKRDALDAELSRLLGDAIARGTPMTARVRIDAKTRGYRLRLDLKQGRERASQRSLDGESCETLVETAALLIAIAHDPSAVVERRDAPLIVEPPPPPPAPEPPVVVPVVKAPQPPPAPIAPWSWTTPVPPSAPVALGFVLRAGPQFGAGDLPSPHPGFAISTALRVEAYRVEGAFELAAGSASTLDGRPNAGADFIRVAGVVRGCRVIVPIDGGAFPRPALLSTSDRTLGVDFSGCLGVELGTLTGEGFGVSDPQRGTAFWAAPRVDLRLGLGLAGPLGVAADVGLAVPVDARRYVLRGSSDGSVLVVHEPAVVAGRAGVMAEIEL
jgi:hypothetical protein